MPEDNLPLPDESPHDASPFDDFINHELDWEPIEGQGTGEDADTDAEPNIAFRIPQEVFDTALERYQKRIAAFFDSILNDATPDEWRQRLETREREIVDALKKSLASEVARRSILSVDDLENMIAQSAILALLADRQMPPILTAAEIMKYLPDDSDDDADEQRFNFPFPSKTDPRWRKGRIFIPKDLVVFEQPRSYSQRTTYPNARWRLNRDTLFIASIVPGWSAIQLPHHKINGFVRSKDATLVAAPRMLRLSRFDIFVIVAIIVLFAVMLANINNLPFTRMDTRLDQLNAEVVAQRTQIANMQTTIDQMRAGRMP
jgi:hypothetical protein